MKSTLHICYFGVREPLVQTQVIPYLKELTKDEIKISLLTFEPAFSKAWKEGEVEDVRKNLRDQGINWYCLPYHKWPSAPATLYDVVRGAFFVRKLIRKHDIDILHARVHVPALIGALARKLTLRRRPKLLFDIRGFFPEEYVDAGNWKRDGWLYKSVKRIESWLLKESDAFVVLTEKAREIMFPESRERGFDVSGRPVEVIPCCVDLIRFEETDINHRNAVRMEMGLIDRKVVAYVGSFGGWYLTSEMLDFFKVCKERDPMTFEIILTQSDPLPLREFLLANGFENNDFMIRKVRPEEIPRILVGADMAISMIKPCYSKLSSSPTKIAEYLACGLPIITNSGIGDVDEFINEDNVGVVLDGMTSVSFREALDNIDKMTLDPDLAERCRNSARRRFDLVDVGGKKYRNLYGRILGIIRT